jgi:hypothetical protein
MAMRPVKGVNEMLTKSYEIWNKNEDEPLVDGLSFEDAAEMSQTYMDFYGADNIVICFRQVKTNKKVFLTNRQKYTSAWINYFEEILLMGNLEFS